MSVGILGVFGLVMIIVLVTIHNYFWELNRQLRKILEKAERARRDRIDKEVYLKESEEIEQERENTREALLLKYEGIEAVMAYRERSDRCESQFALGLLQTPRDMYWRGFCHKHSILADLCLEVGTLDLPRFRRTETNKENKWKKD